MALLNYSVLKYGGPSELFSELQIFPTGVAGNCLVPGRLFVSKGLPEDGATELGWDEGAWSRAYAQPDFM
jgi:hypothetical protein